MGEEGELEGARQGCAPRNLPARAEDGQRRAEPAAVCKNGSIHFIMYRFSEQPWQRGRGATLPAPFLQMGKLRPEEGKPFVQGHTE